MTSKHVGHWTEKGETIEVWVSDDPRRDADRARLMQGGAMPRAYWTQCLSESRQLRRDRGFCDRTRYYVTDEQWAQMQTWPEVTALESVGPEGAVADSLRAVGARYLGVYEGARFWEHEHAARHRDLVCGRQYEPCARKPAVYPHHKGLDMLIYPRTTREMREAGLFESLGEGGEDAGSTGSAVRTDPRDSDVRSSPPLPASLYCIRNTAPEAESTGTGWPMANQRAREQVACLPTAEQITACREAKEGPC